MNDLSKITLKSAWSSLTMEKNKSATCFFLTQTLSTFNRQTVNFAIVCFIKSKKMILFIFNVVSKKIIQTFNL